MSTMGRTTAARAVEIARGSLGVAALENRLRVAEKPRRVREGSGAS